LIVKDLEGVENGPGQLDKGLKQNRDLLYNIQVYEEQQGS